MNRQPSHILQPITVIAVAAILYLAFLSRQFDQNGLIEAMAVEQGSASLLAPNHLIYRPLCFLIYQLALYGGYAGHSIYILQAITAICSAIGIGISFSFFRRLAGSALPAWLVTLFLATSWSYWTFSTDAYYIAPAMLCTAATLAFILRPRIGWLHISGAVVLTTLAILIWQANLFVIPALLLLIILVPQVPTLRARVGLAVWFGLLTGGSITLIYGVIAIAVLGHPAVTEIWHWSTCYGGSRLPLWGCLDVARLAPAIISAVASLIPLWEGLGLHDLLRGQLRLDHLPQQLALLGLLILSLITMLQLWNCRFKQRQAELFVLVFAYVSYLPFIIWWDPFEPKWFMLPNLFLAGALAIIWRGVQFRLSRTLLLVLALVLIGIGNFAATIWPRHSQPGQQLQQAACIANATTPSDLLVMTDWRWHVYLPYFYQRTVFNLLHEAGVSASPAIVMQRLKEAIMTTQQAGGEVYLADLGQYSLAEATWFAEQTGLSIEDLRNLPSKPAFDCDEVHFRQIVSPASEVESRTSVLSTTAPADS